MSVLVRSMIPLISQYFSHGMFELWFVPVLALGFIATVPCIIRWICWRH